jgi:hypothetical protein
MERANDRLSPEARELATYMSELSEEAYCAGWMTDLEYELWDIVQTGPRKYGRLDITTDHIARLRTLADRCGGWIVFDDEKEEVFVPMDRWLALVAPRR